MKYSTEMNKKIGLGIIGLLALAIWSFANSTPSENNVSASDEYKLVFSDEFNLPDGSQPDSTKWRRCNRYAGLWSRWISDSRDVVYIKNGCLVCRAVPNRKERGDTARMLTGAIETMGKYSFMYGKLEVRMKTNSKDGNFPAVWMRDDYVKAKRNVYSEIDIVEMFGRKKKSFHTAHTQLTVDNPQYRRNNSFNHDIDITKWHVYGLIWTPESLIWTVDGNEVGRYSKSLDQSLLDKHQWTFNVPHYIRLNQSVGDGVHDMKQNVRETYVTQFDWIRVYQAI